MMTNLTPKGDQVRSIKELTNNIKNNIKTQVLLGATGTGKTFTIANVINKIQQNTLVIVHNKTLAAQLYGEFKTLFPENNVEYYISYFDFYQPEAYIPRTDTYIEKSTKTNQEIEMMRLSTINSLSSKTPTIVIASVASIYASVSPHDFQDFKIVLKKDNIYNLKQLQYDLVKLQYQRNNIELKPGTFIVKGDIVDIAPGYADDFFIRINFTYNKITSITVLDSTTKKLIREWNQYVVVPANEYILNKERWDESLKRIQKELNERLSFFKKNNRLLEAQRLKERTERDIESLQELGFCSGIENYSAHLELRNSGSTPYTIFDYFDKDNWLLVIDESHMTIPQIKGMYNTDRSRKETLVNYGFRLPSALDNRPLNFAEFQQKMNNVIYVSATPNQWEIDQAKGLVVQQIIRPTGLLDPTVEVRKSEYQIDDIVNELRKQVDKKERTFITVLTIKMAEALCLHLRKLRFKVMFMHNELKTLERTKIINDLRKGTFDIVVGINLLREGLDVPEVSLIFIIDADKPGFFRSTQALIQTFGRVARNEHGHIIMYANQTTSQMQAAIDETNRRRLIQQEFNKQNNITPHTIVKPLNEIISAKEDIKAFDAYLKGKKNIVGKTSKAIRILKKEMLQAAKNKEYERAAYIRDMIIEFEENK